MDTDSSAFLDLESKRKCRMTLKGVSGTIDKRGGGIGNALFHACFTFLKFLRSSDTCNLQDYHLIIVSDVPT